ncbi:MAG: hypothetical protein ACRCX2_37885 [Paraclostridium sp.]
MFNIFNQEDKEKGSYEERNHQDNFYSNSAYNDNFQYCRRCNLYNRFEYDRCVVCKSN